MEPELINDVRECFWISVVGNDIDIEITNRLVFGWSIADNNGPMIVNDDVDNITQEQVLLGKSILAARN